MSQINLTPNSQDTPTYEQCLGNKGAFFSSEVNEAVYVSKGDGTYYTLNGGGGEECGDLSITLKDTKTQEDIWNDYNGQYSSVFKLSDSEIIELREDEVDDRYSAFIHTIDSEGIITLGSIVNSNSLYDRSPDSIEQILDGRYFVNTYDNTVFISHYKLDNTLEIISDEDMFSTYGLSSIFKLSDTSVIITQGDSNNGNQEFRRLDFASDGTYIITSQSVADVNVGNKYNLKPYLDISSNLLYIPNYGNKSISIFDYSDPNSITYTDSLIHQLNYDNHMGNTSFLGDGFGNFIISIRDKVQSFSNNGGVITLGTLYWNDVPEDELEFIGDTPGILKSFGEKDFLLSGTNFYSAKIIGLDLEFSDSGVVSGENGESNRKKILELTEDISIYSSGYDAGSTQSQRGSSFKSVTITPGDCGCSCEAEILNLQNQIDVLDITVIDLQDQIDNSTGGVTIEKVLFSDMIITTVGDSKVYKVQHDLNKQVICQRFDNIDEEIGTGLVNKLNYFEIDIKAAIDITGFYVLYTK